MSRMNNEFCNPKSTSSKLRELAFGPKEYLSDWYKVTVTTQPQFILMNAMVSSYIADEEIHRFWLLFMAEFFESEQNNE